MAIKIMDEALTNKIAAGEVVERPRSIVKELVENALDAGATEIKIILAQAGIRKITVIDNGTGMSEADASLAFVRHATSKIFSEHDLFAIHTLGFRGEALAAIAAVSKVRLLTGRKNEPGTEIQIDGGVVMQQHKIDGTAGTTIEVNQLFYNTPARLKHLKSLQTEYAHTLEYLQKMALARPDVRFEFTHDEKLVFKTYGTGKLAETLVMIYGERIADSLFPVSISDADFSVQGMITHPQIQRSHNRVINLTVNGRSIRHYGINRAILRGYGNLIPKGMFPIVALDITLDVKLVDVNVHPAKLEVRISQERVLEQLIEKMIKEALAQENLLYQDVGRPQKMKTAEQLNMPTSQFSPTALTGAEQVLKDEDNAHKHLGNTQTHQPKLSAQAQEIAAQIYEIPTVMDAQSTLQENQVQDYLVPGGHINDGKGSAQRLEAAEDLPPLTTDTNQQTTAGDEPTFVEARTALQMLHVIGQFDASYILAQADNVLYFIDQHAAQERIRYDEHMRKVRAMEQIVRQDLLFPLTIFLEARDMQVVFEHEAELVQNGIEFEKFADHEIRVNTVPSWIKQENVETYIRKAIDCVVQFGNVDAAIIREKELIMLSCRYSIKAHDVLSVSEMEALIAQLSQTQTPFTCPHGRPIVVKQQLYEIERWFKRV